MSLHIEVGGRGEPLVMLHGWGMHGGVWGEAVARLAQEFEVHCVDLPGHGFSRAGEEVTGNPPGRERANGARWASPFTLDSVVEELSARFAGPVNLLGWSLGGMIAQHWAARAPGQVEKLILVASTPCFAARAGWECGMLAEVLEQFAAGLEADFAATLKRFLALQVRGVEGERELLAALRARVSGRAKPQADALRGGLGILRDADLRGALTGIGQPVLVMAGERDRITPPQASHYMARVLPSARMAVIKGAAHTPFLSHQEEFVSQIAGFLKE